MARLSEVLVFLIEKGPGRTESELADAIGERALEHQISMECRRLVDRERVRRRGIGSLFVLPHLTMPPVNIIIRSKLTD